jgi:hypothetical protein
MMTQEGPGGLTVDNLYPGEAPSEEVDLAKIPVSDEGAGAKGETDSAEPTRGSGSLRAKCAGKRRSAADRSWGKVRRRADSNR